MLVITGSVGRNGVNTPADVEKVQKLINENLYLMPNINKLAVDKRVGHSTITAITIYQRNILKIAIPDGRIDPNGKTFKRLQETTHKKRPANVSVFIGKTLADARLIKAKYKIPVSILIAQAGLESGWGLNVKDNAYFGIKSHKTTGQTSLFKTSEYINGNKTVVTDAFRAYANFREAAEDYGKFLTSNPIYRSAFVYINDPYKFAEKTRRQVMPLIQCTHLN